MLPSDAHLRNGVPYTPDGCTKKMKFSQEEVQKKQLIAKTDDDAEELRDGQLKDVWDLAKQTVDVGAKAAKVSGVGQGRPSDYFGHFLHNC